VVTGLTARAGQDGGGERLRVGGLVGRCGILRVSGGDGTVEWRVLRAHTNGPRGERDGLREHLVKVAQKAREFGAVFGAGETAELLGMLHDVGKGTPGFQEYLVRLESGERLSHGPPHSIWGAALAYWVI